MENYGSQLDVHDFLFLIAARSIQPILHVGVYLLRLRNIADHKEFNTGLGDLPLQLFHQVDQGVRNAES